ncbi:MAG: LacI family DNA-binding transcriptional regulator [Phycisphaerales bacterium]|nr:LacI family DNA-binding transcriptional regulator [Phycisphaerales bacterium]
MIAPKAPLTSVDIARLAGVAPSTISRVLNRAGGFSKQTERRVLEVVRKTGYRPSLAASSLSRKANDTIGLITEIEGQPGYYGPQLIRGISLALSQYSKRLAMDTVHRGDEASSIEKLPLFRSRSVDGYIFDTHQAAGDLQGMANHLSLPYVFVNSRYTLPINTIMPDDVDAAKQATEHLIRHGHKRIGYFPSAYTQVHSSQENRMKGYLQAILTAGLQPVPMWDVPLDKKGKWLTVDDYLPRLKTYLDEFKCTAVVTYHAFAAACVFSGCYQLGIRVPQDLSIIASDYDPILEYLPVRITSIQLDRIEIGKLAVEMLIQQIDNPEDNQITTVLVDGSLKKFDSVGPPAADRSA